MLSCSEVEVCRVWIEVVDLARSTVLVPRRRNCWMRRVRRTRGVRTRERKHRVRAQAICMVRRLMVV